MVNSPVAAFSKCQGHPGLTSCSGSDQPVCGQPGVGGAMQIRRASALASPRHPPLGEEPAALPGLNKYHILTPRAGAVLFPHELMRRVLQAQRGACRGCRQAKDTVPWRKGPRSQAVSRKGLVSTPVLPHAVWPWASGLTSLSLSFLLYDMGFIPFQMRNGVGMDKS